MHAESEMIHRRAESPDGQHPWSACRYARERPRGYRIRSAAYATRG